MQPESSANNVFCLFYPAMERNGCLTIQKLLSNSLAMVKTANNIVYPDLSLSASWTFHYKDTLN